MNFFFTAKPNDQKPQLAEINILHSALLSFFFTYLTIGWCVFGVIFFQNNSTHWKTDLALPCMGWFMLLGPRFWWVFRDPHGVSSRVSLWMLLLLLQKSGDHRLGCKKPCKYWGKLGRTVKLLGCKGCIRIIDWRISAFLSQSNWLTLGDGFWPENSAQISQVTVSCMKVFYSQLSLSQL